MQLTDSIHMLYVLRVSVCVGVYMCKSDLCQIFFIGSVIIECKISKIQKRGGQVIIEFQ